MSGKVILVGAGPGDAGLLTIRGRDAVSRADVVVYDRLVGAEILALIPENAEKINAGKASANHLIPQEEINRILLDNALAGKVVVRLKGGDPFLFGRGGEELELLAENGVEFEVIPGVTSAIAAPAYAGIPVTHRDFCSSVHIITGHARENLPPKIDFASLVNIGGTLVFLMSVSSLCYICEGLLGAGMAPEMPAAIVENGTLPAQRRVVATVGTLVRRAAERGVKSPAIIVVGRVCELSDSFCRFEKRPLFGRNIVVTRPKSRIGTLSGALRELGADVIEYPCIETREISDNAVLDIGLERLSGYSWVAFTSPAGVEITLRRMWERGLDARAFSGVKIAAVGSATAAELQKFGLCADLVPDVFNAAALGMALTESASGNVLILRARDGSKELTAALEKARIPYCDVPVYDTVYASEKSAAVAELLARGEIDAVTFTSASTVRGFAESLKSTELLGITAICIGSATAAEASRHGMKPVVAENAVIADLVAAVLQYFTEEI